MVTSGRNFSILAFPVKKIPAVTLIECRRAHKLRAVQHRSPTYGKQDINAFFLTYRGHTVYRGMPGIRLNAPRLKKTHTGLFRLFDDGRVQFCFLETFTAVDQ